MQNLHGSTLDTDVGLSDSHLVTEGEPDWSRLFGAPADGGQRTAPSYAEEEGAEIGHQPDLAAMSVAQVRAYLLGLLEELARSPDALLDDELHEDGTRSVSSQIAVALLGAAAAAAGRKRLVNLASTDYADLRSIGGLARLVHGAVRQGASA